MLLELVDIWLRRTIVLSSDVMYDARNMSSFYALCMNGNIIILFLLSIHDTLIVVNDQAIHGPLSGTSYGDHNHWALGVMYGKGLLPSH